MREKCLLADELRVVRERTSGANVIEELGDISRGGQHLGFALRNEWVLQLLPPDRTARGMRFCMVE